eukprot:5594732-Alexandrium_andersonii.AAC.1
MSRASSARAAATSSESRTAPATSPRNGCPPDYALRPSEHLDTDGAGGSSTARKSEMSSASASPTPMLFSGSMSCRPSATKSNA